MLSTRIHYSILLAILILTACQDAQKETLRVVNLSPFNAIELNGVFNVYLIQDTTFSVLVSGYEDVPGQVSFFIHNDTLSITDHSKNKWLHPETDKIKLYVHSNPLREITAHATCYFETINAVTSDQFRLIMGAETKLMEGNMELNCNNFLYWNSHLCGGKLTLRGNVNDLQLYTFATASVDASNLSAKRAWIDNNSKGNCEVFVKDRLEYSIRGTGNIYLHGNPLEIILNERTASGQLIIR